MLLATYYAQNYAGIIGWSLPPKIENTKGVNHPISTSQINLLLILPPLLLLQTGTSVR